MRNGKNNKRMAFRLDSDIVYEIKLNNLKQKGSLNWLSLNMQ